MVSRVALPDGPVVVVDSSSVVPVSAIYLWFRAGAAGEPEAWPGAAHLLEHMLFKGAGGHGPGEAPVRVEALGGDLNAYTAYEQTVLHATLPAGREAEVVGLLGEMALVPHLDPEELRRERDVVLEEIRMSQDEPGQRLADGLRARVYGKHPYGRPILGTMESIRAIQAEDLRAWHQAAFHPSRAVLAVAGPVSLEAVIDAVRTRWPRVPPAPPLPPRPSAARGRPDTFTVDGGFEERMVEIAYPAPPLGHPDLAALDLLITALGEGEAGLLNARLKLALGLASDTWTALENEPRGSLLVFGLSAREGKVVEAAEALAALLAEVARDGVPPSHLHRARAGILATRMFDRETADGRAHRLCWYEAQFGDLDHETRYEAELLRTTASDLRRVAATWLVPTARVVGAVAPRRQLSATRLRAVIDGGGQAVQAAAPPPRLRRETLGQGARVVVQSEPDAELVSVTLVGVGGALVEGARNPGLADVWAATVARGAADRDAATVAEIIEARAGSLAPWSFRNSCGITATFPAGELGTALDLLCDVVLDPTFAAEEVARAVAEQEEARQSQSDSPGDLAWDLAYHALYPGHPWGRPSVGTRAGLARVTSARLRAFHRSVMVGQNLVFAVAGAADPERVLRRLGQRLAKLPSGAPVPWDPPVVPEHLQAVVRRRSRRAQAHLVLAFPGAGWGSPEAPALSLVEGLLGSQSGRLFAELREKRGLAYDVGATSEEGLGGGTLLASLATDPGRVDEAWAALWSVIDALADGEIPAAELDRVRTRAVEGAVLDLQRTSSRAAQLAAAERYGPGADQLDALIQAPRQVDDAALRAVVRSVLRRDRCAQVTVGA